MADSPIQFLGAYGGGGSWPYGPTISRSYGHGGFVLLQLVIVGNSPSLDATLSSEWTLLGDHLVQASPTPSHYENWIGGSPQYSRTMFFWTDDSTGTLTGTTNASRWNAYYTIWSGTVPGNPFMPTIDTHTKTFSGTVPSMRVWSPTFSDPMSVPHAGAGLWIFGAEAINQALPRTADGTPLANGAYLPEESSPINRTVTSSLYTGSSGALLAAFRTAPDYRPGLSIGTSIGGSGWSVS